MQIIITNRSTVEQTVFKPKTALISITDYGWTFAKLRNKPDYLLQLAFDDVDNDIFEDEPKLNRSQVEQKYHMLTNFQAVQIADFYFEVRDKVDTIIVQCEHGQSRSAAVASAIMQYENENAIDIFTDDRYYPNKAIYKKVFKAISH